MSKQGDFSFIPEKNMVFYLQDMYQVINTQTPELWNTLKNFQEESFMLSSEKWITDLTRTDQTTSLADPSSYESVAREFVPIVRL